MMRKHCLPVSSIAALLLGLAGCSGDGAVNLIAGDAGLEAEGEAGGGDGKGDRTGQGDGTGQGEATGRSDGGGDGQGGEDGRGTLDGQGGGDGQGTQDGQGWEQLSCLPGEGCFGDKCSENSQCQSGWCVEHLGERICTIECTEECPPGWVCRQLKGVFPDVVFACVSNFSNLCKPCVTGDACMTFGGADDVCVSYGEGGNFCGGACDKSNQCPWGFVCEQVKTVDGVEITQCVSETGECPCTDDSVKLGLFTHCTKANEIGTCEGKRVCAADGLTACDAAVPEAESCDGKDTDCDGLTDEPMDADGNLVPLCDDGNACTDDLCAGDGGCESIATLDGTECKDGDLCTVGDHCTGGVCVGAAVQCNDSNYCTNDSCDGLGGCLFEPNYQECDDQDPCTVGDLCKKGECAGTPVSCDCVKDADCAALEYGDVCNGKLHCNKDFVPFRCEVVPGSEVSCPDPTGPAAPCQDAVCDPVTGACSFAAANEGMACDDEDPCTAGDKCKSKTCQAGEPINCNDGNLCTDDSCSEGIGCLHVPNNAACSDGNACTVGDVCIQTQCASGAPAKCDDFNPCTDDSCDPATGCKQVPAQAECDDGNACTVGDHCQAGSCVSAGLVECIDGNPCTDDSCDPVNGCVFKINTVPCNDLNACTLDDACKMGKCTGTKPLSCDDGNACTDDSCDTQAGCKHVYNAKPCDDGNACTTGDSCKQGQCTGAGALKCNDSNPCTDDSCDMAAGCIFTPNAAPCSDGDVCTENDACKAGTCAAGTSLDCNDGNVCTNESCNPKTGCAHAFNINACDDGNACTPSDVCKLGQCIGSGTLQCSDGNLCTDDACDLQLGCQYKDNAVACNDSNACTLTDACSGGACTGSGVPNCDDGNNCMADSCEPATGCTHVPVPNCCGNGIIEPGETCDDGNKVDGDGCKNNCTAGTCCSNQAEFTYQVVPGVWACVNKTLITTYEENNAMCAAGCTPATYKLVQGLEYPSLAKHQAFRDWYNQVVPNNGNYIRTGQKRRGGCTPTAHGDLYVPNPDWGYSQNSGWQDLYFGGPSCTKDTGSANNMEHALAGVICVAGVYEPPAP